MRGLSIIGIIVLGMAEVSAVFAEESASWNTFQRKPFS